MVDLLTGIGRRTFHTDSTDICGIVEYAESVSLEYVIKFDKGHAEAGVRFVAAIEAHGVSPSHAWKIAVDFNTTYFFKEMFSHAFKHAYNIFLLYKAHLTVDLREFRLAIGP